MNTDYPHYYLADVPHELRQRVLDLCIHRQWQAAHELLHSAGFYKYSLGGLQSFYDWAPSVLEPPPSEPVSSNPTGVNQTASPAAALPESPAPAAADPSPNPEPALPTAEADFTSKQPQAECPPPEPPALPPCRGRSKISMLPPEIREEINTRLENHRTLQSVSDWLASVGYPGISTENVFQWKHHGFRDWLEERERLEQISSLRQWATEVGRDNSVADIPTAVASFVTARLYSLLRGVEAPFLIQLLRDEPKQFICYVDRLLRASRVSMKAEQLRQSFGAAKTEVPGVITPETLAEIEKALRLM